MSYNQNIEIIYRNWIAQIGDNAILPWIATGLYALAFVASVLKYRRLKDRGLGRESQLWMLLALLLFVMGTNKELDFQVLLRNVGRYLADSGGWHEKARSVQALFTYAIMGIMGIGGLFVIIIIARVWRSNIFALAGASSICLYIAIRTAEINHVIADLKGHEEVHFKFSDAIEIAGVCLILINAVIRNKSERT